MTNIRQILATAPETLTGTDPVEEAEKIIAKTNLVMELTRHLPDRIRAESLELTLAHHMQAFKAAVQNEMLESQKAANDALAAALRGGRG